LRITTLIEKGASALGCVPGGGPLAPMVPPNGAGPVPRPTLGVAWGVTPAQLAALLAAPAAEHLPLPRFVQSPQQWLDAGLSKDQP